MAASPVVILRGATAGTQIVRGQPGRWLDARPGQGQRATRVPSMKRKPLRQRCVVKEELGDAMLARLTCWRSEQTTEARGVHVHFATSGGCLSDHVQALELDRGMRTHLPGP